MLGFVDICSVPSPSSWMFLAAPPTNLKIVAQRWSRNTKFVGSSMWRAGFLTPAWRRYKEVLEDPFCGKRMKQSQSSSISSLTSKYINLWYISIEVVPHHTIPVLFWCTPLFAWSTFFDWTFSALLHSLLSVLDIVTEVSFAAGAELGVVLICLRKQQEWKADIHNHP